MHPGAKAKELLKEIDTRISDLEKELKNLKADRREISKIVARLSGGAIRGKASSNGRKRKSPQKAAGKRKRTDWEKVISKFSGTFTLDDLAKASKKKKGTVNQAVQSLKKAGKIVPTGKRGEYKRNAA